MKDQVGLRIQEAMENVRGLIADGEPPEQALRIISQESGFSTEVLARRAQAALGALDNLRERQEREAAPIRAQALVDAAISKYVALGTLEDTRSWLTNEIGRTPNEAEIDRAFWGAINRVLSKQGRFLD